jgi:hypothetical protein
MRWRRITKQPSNLRNRQRVVREMTFGEIKLEPLHYTGKCQFLGSKQACERSRAYAHFASDDSRLRFAVSQKATNDVFNA